MLNVKRLRDKVFRTVPKNLYLKQILDRHENEYIQILNMVIDYNNKSERGLGFWSLIRMIFPVIESVAFIIGKNKEDFLEENLHVPVGHLVWEIYRHSLMHTDELRYAVYKEKTISWAAHLSTENIGHVVEKEFDGNPTTIHLDIPGLYSDLRDFLISEIAKNDDSPVRVEVGIHFPDHKSKVIDELEELYTKY